MAALKPVVESFCPGRLHLFSPLKMLGKQIAACAFRGSLFFFFPCACAFLSSFGQLLCSYDAVGLCDVRFPLGCLFFPCTF